MEKTTWITNCLPEYAQEPIMNVLNLIDDWHEKRDYFAKYDHSNAGKV